MKRFAVRSLLVVLAAACAGIVIVPAAQAAKAAAAPAPSIERAMDDMVAELLGRRAGSAPGSKSVARTGPVHFDGSAWQSGSGAAGTSAFGLQMDRAVTTALAARRVNVHAGSSLTEPGSKGVGGSVLRGGFKLIKGGMNVTLSLVDANTGRVISEARRMLSASSLTGMAMDNLLPPDAGNARALAQLVTQSVGGGASAFRVEVSTDRGQQGAYFENDPLRVSVRAERDCYLRLYHVSWGDKTLTMIFPNEGDRESFLPAGTIRQVPSPGSTAEFVVSKPYGVDAIIAIASTQPFEDEAWVTSQLAAQPGAPAEAAPEVAPEPAADASLGSRGVVRSGPYLAAEGATEARARGILAKGLLVRQNGSPAAPGRRTSSVGEGSSPQFEGGQPTGGVSPDGAQSGSSATPLGAPAPQATRGQVAKASCYYTTLPRLSLGR